MTNGYALLRIAGLQFAIRLPARTKEPDWSQLSKDESVQRKLSAAWRRFGRKSSIPCLQPYTGNVEAQAFRLKTDPHPHALIVVSVCLMLQNAHPKYRTAFWQVFVLGRPQSRWQDEVDAMSAEMDGLAEHWDVRTVVQQYVAEWRLERIEEQRRKRNERDRAAYCAKRLRLGILADSNAIDGELEESVA